MKGEGKGEHHPKKLSKSCEFCHEITNTDKYGVPIDPLDKDDLENAADKSNLIFDDYEHHISEFEFDNLQRKRTLQNRIWLDLEEEISLSWTKISEEMGTYHKNLSKSLSKLAETSKKLSKKTRTSIFSSLSDTSPQDSSNPYQIFHIKEENLLHFNTDSLEKFRKGQVHGEGDEIPKHQSLISKCKNKIFESSFDLSFSDSIQKGKSITKLYFFMFLLIVLYLYILSILNQINLK